MQQIEDGGMRIFSGLLRDRRGATAIEYGLIAALIAVAAIGAMSALGGQITTTFNNVTANMKAS
jgi:pilus assembly protein Flp/PilA